MTAANLIHAFQFIGIAMMPAQLESQDSGQNVPTVAGRAELRYVTFSVSSQFGSQGIAIDVTLLHKGKRIVFPLVSASH